jgi:AcrR family transcriptional regulator
MAKPKQNLYGQEMGNKGSQTRAKILKATHSLIQKRPLRELKVSEIGALAGVSSSTFYLYFQTVSEAALAIAEEANQSNEQILRILEREWTTDNIFDHCRDFVKSYFSFWADHAAILRLRNFAADEGDKRFVDARRRSVEPIHFALQKKLADAQAKTSIAPELHPPSAASVLVATLERTAVVVLLPSAHKATRSKQIEVVAYLIASAILGEFATPSN